MSTRARQGGLSLIELVMFIIIVSTAVVGILQVVSLTTGRSADPLLRKQALAIAESLLEEVELARFTFCDPSDAQADIATRAAVSAVAPLGCVAVVEQVGQAGGEVNQGRPFDNVNDYVSAYGAPQAAFDNGAGALVDANGNPVSSGPYTARLTIGATDTLGRIASNAADPTVLRITVEVRYGDESVVLEGYRVRYAPN